MVVGSQAFPIGARQLFRGELLNFQEVFLKGLLTIFWGQNHQALQRVLEAHGLNGVHQWTPNGGIGEFLKRATISCGAGMSEKKGTYHQ